MSYQYEDGLITERLITRFLTTDDIPVWAKFFEDKEATEFFPKRNTSSEEQAKQMIDKQLVRYRENRFGFQALIDRKSNEFIGICGLLLQDVNGKQELEVGYHLFKTSWGLGLATEASGKFKAYCFENALSESLVSIINIQNTRSQRVAIKNGMTREMQTFWYEQDVYVYRVKRKDEK